MLETVTVELFAGRKIAGVNEPVAGAIWNEAFALSDPSLVVVVMEAVTSEPGAFGPTVKSKWSDLSPCAKSVYVQVTLLVVATQPAERSPLVTNVSAPAGQVIAVVALASGVVCSTVTSSVVASPEWSPVFGGPKHGLPWKTGSQTAEPESMTMLTPPLLADAVAKKTLTDASATPAAAATRTFFISTPFAAQ